MTPNRPLTAASRHAVSGCTAVIGAGLLLLAGCTSQAPAVEPAVEVPAPQGPWFCEPAIGDDGWRCVDTPALVANPRPSRPLSIALMEADARRAAGTNPAVRFVSGVNATAAGTAGSTMIEIGDSTMTTTVTRAQTLTNNNGVEAEDQAVLADQPAEPVSMLALPPEYYVVQLATLDSPERLQATVDDLGNSSLSAARVEADGALRYALLLGVYETFAAAELAATSVPASFDRLEPWIRRLGSLQAAMLRAEQQRE